MLAAHGRYDYSPITERAPFDWPNGKRLAVYLGLNLEHFAFGEGLSAELAPGGPQPDVLNYAWRDYGNRVGAWRILALLDQLALPASVIANSAMYPYRLRHLRSALTHIANQSDRIWLTRTGEISAYCHALSG